MALEYKNRRTFPLRLPPFIELQASLLAQREGISLHHFVVLAIDEMMLSLQRKNAELDSANPQGTALNGPAKTAKTKV